jgi:hypothetical protein
MALAMAGHIDGRTYRQWLQAGRQVKRGEKATFILRPITSERRRRRRASHRPSGWGEAAPLSEQEQEAEDERDAPHCFAVVAVFGADQTEGKPLSYEPGRRESLEAEPVVQVARRWGLHDAQCLPGGDIGAWARWLAKEAQARVPSFAKLDPEVSDAVTELAGAALRHALGLLDPDEDEASRGRVLKFFEQAKGDQSDSLQVLLERAWALLRWILLEAENPGLLPAPEPAGASQEVEERQAPSGIQRPGLPSPSGAPKGQRFLQPGAAPRVVCDTLPPSTEAQAQGLLF